MASMRVILDNYSSFYDIRNGTHFTPTLDKRSGCYVAIADVDESLAGDYARAPYRVLSDEEYAEILGGAPAAEPSAPLTGDPLADAAVQAVDALAAEEKAGKSGAKGGGKGGLRLEAMPELPSTPPAPPESK